MFGQPGPMTYYEVRVVLFVENGEIRIIDKASPVKKRVQSLEILALSASVTKFNDNLDFVEIAIFIQKRIAIVDSSNPFFHPFAFRAHAKIC